MFRQQNAASVTTSCSVYTSVSRSIEGFIEVEGWIIRDHWSSFSQWRLMIYWHISFSQVCKLRSPIRQAHSTWISTSVQDLQGFLYIRLLIRIQDMRWIHMHASKQLSRSLKGCQSATFTMDTWVIYDDGFSHLNSWLLFACCESSHRDTQERDI